jgi:hypothetical protein
MVNHRLQYGMFSAPLQPFPSRIVYKKKAMSEKWGQKNGSPPFRFKRGGGVHYVSDPDISAILFEKNRE